MKTTKRSWLIRIAFILVLVLIAVSFCASPP